MKKITFLLMLFVTALGFSQTEMLTNGDFSNGKDSWSGSDFTVVSGEAFFAATNAGGNPWDTQLVQGSLSFNDAQEYVLTFKARSTVNRKITVAIQNVGIWNDQFRQDFDITSTMATYTATFNATSTNANVQIGFLMAGFGNTEGVYYDDVSLTTTGSTGGGGSTGTPPTDAAPTPPTRDAGDVLSVYSDAYTNMALNLDAGWCGGGAVETVQIANNNTVLYKGLDCQGIVLDAGVDASAFTKMHIDVYIANEVDLTGKVFNLKFVGTPTSQVVEYNFNGGSNPPLTKGSWISIDIDVDLSTIGDWKEFGITSNIKDSSLWYDNFYVYKDSGSGGGGSGDITVAAPDNPTFANASEYSSVFSGLGSATGITPSAFAGASISEVTIGGNVSTKIEVPTGGGGGQFAFAPIDLVAGGFTHIYFNYYFDGTPEAGKVINYNIQGGGANIFGTEALPSSKSANNQSWSTVNVALSSLNNPGDPKNAISQVQFTMAGGSNPFGTVYIDNVIFYQAGTANVENNELLGFSMYPNPANNVLNISAKETISKADIFNVLGKKVMSVNINKTKDAIDVSNLSSGIYLIKYNVNDKVGTAKFIKQ